MTWRNKTGALEEISGRIASKKLETFRLYTCLRALDNQGVILEKAGIDELEVPVAQI